MLRTLPALQAAYCVLHRRPIPGKVAALIAWQELRPEEPILAELRELVETGLAAPQHISGEAVESLGNRCRQLVDELASMATAGSPLPGAGSTRGLGDARDAGPESNTAQALLDLHDAVRFSRLRPAHYRWFALAPAGFQNEFFLVNEMATLRRSIVGPAAFALAASTGREMGAATDPEAILLKECRTDPESL